MSKNQRIKGKRTHSPGGYVRRRPAPGPVAVVDGDPVSPTEEVAPLTPADEPPTAASVTPVATRAKASVGPASSQGWLPGLPPPAAVAAIELTGFAAFFSSFGNAFNSGDDQTQIVGNLPVHSISNIALFFQGGTFYNGKGLEPLQGVYYRPLQTTAYSFLYSIFGAQPIAFHAAEAMLCTASAALVYLILTRLSIRSWPALFIALVFLVHPIDSEVAFTIPSMQDALFVFFGLLSVYLITATDSWPGLGVGIGALMLALLAKETAVLFVAIDLLYLYWWKKRLLLRFVASAIAPSVLWLIMRVGAIGWDVNPHNAPIAALDLSGRLATIPSMILLYIRIIVWPFKQASAYYFVHPTVTVGAFAIPLVIDSAVIGVFIWAGVVIQRNRPRRDAHGYWFFAIWAALGLATHLQVIPIDGTASEAWFYFPMIGVLGMCAFAGRELVGVIHVDMRVLAAAGMTTVMILGVATASRGRVWGNFPELVTQDLANSPDDYVAQIQQAGALLVNGDPQAALPYAEASIATFPTTLNYNTEGLIYTKLANYPAAVKAFQIALTYGQWSSTYNNLAAITAVYGDPAANRAFLVQMTTSLPSDPVFWYYLAVLDYQHGRQAAAKEEVAHSLSLDPSDEAAQTVSQRMAAGGALNMDFRP